MASHRIQAFFKYEHAVFNVEQEKESTNTCEDEIEKSVPHDAKWWSSGWIFPSHNNWHFNFFSMV